MPKRPPSTTSGLHTALVRDAMTTPIVTCTPDVPIEEVAELMTEHGIHSVVVLAAPIDNPAPAHRRWGVLSDLDLMAAVPWGEEAAQAGSIAASPQAVIRADESLAAAAQLMAEYSTTHLLVTEGFIRIVQRSAVLRAEVPGELTDVAGVGRLLLQNPILFAQACQLLALLRREPRPALRAIRAGAPDPFA